MSLFRHDKRFRKFAFTLLEILVAITVLSLVVLVLANILGQSTAMWQKGLNDSQHRQRARAMLDLIGRDLRQACLSVDRARQDSLRFEINPPALTALSIQNSDALFWQAPVSTAESGELAEVGYFVHWSDGKAALYRFFLDCSDPRYDAVEPNSSILTIPDWSDYIFLENVIGLWINAYDKNGAILAEPFDSRSSRALPASVEIFLVLLDSRSASRLTAAPGYTADASSFIDGLPADVRPGASVVSMRVNLENSTGW